MSVARDKNGRAAVHGPPPRAAHGRANGVSRKRRYERTTPIGRARKNLAKVGKALDLVKGRLQSWGAADGARVGGNEQLDEAMRRVTATQAGLAGAMLALGVLEKSGFVPVRRSSVVTFEAEDEVRVVDKYRDKYLEVYPADVIGALVVVKVLPSGEIAVKHGKTALIVPKSHLGRRA